MQRREMAEQLLRSAAVGEKAKRRTEEGEKESEGLGEVGGVGEGLPYAPRR